MQQYFTSNFYDKNYYEIREHLEQNIVLNQYLFNLNPAFVKHQMVTSNYGKLSEYDSSKEDWQSYIERLELYFTANDIDDEEKRKAILLTSCGIECYHLFKGLTTPTKPVDKTFIELVTLMTNHENPKRNPIAERFVFNMRNRKLGESISQYMAELRRLSQYCEYGDSLESML